jgi:hypothetical protein
MNESRIGRAITIKKDGIDDTIISSARFIIAANIHTNEIIIAFADALIFIKLPLMVPL